MDTEEFISHTLCCNYYYLIDMISVAITDCINMNNSNITGVMHAFRSEAVVEIRAKYVPLQGHPGPNSMVSHISQNIVISLWISHFGSLCDRDYPPNPLDQKLWVSHYPLAALLGKMAIPNDVILKIRKL